MSGRSPEREVLVIGGGPGGAAAAGLLASWGVDVALVTRSDPPGGWLAESIPASARKLMERVGVLDAVERVGLFENGGNTVWWARRPGRSEPFANGVIGFHAERARLENALLDSARRRGVTVEKGEPVRSVERVSDGWKVARGETTLRARWLLDASGRAGVLARQHRLEDRPTGTLAVAGRWRSSSGFGSEPDSGRDHTLIESYADGWAWSVPLSGTERAVTAMIDPRETTSERTGDVDALLHAELAKTPELAKHLENAEFQAGARACPASLYSSQRYGGDGHLLVGDAASFIDPLSSYGVKKALASGWLSAVAVRTALSDTSLASSALDYFDARERDVYRQYRRLSVPFFEEAAGEYGTPYWERRAEAARVAGGVERGETFDGAPLDPADTDSSGSDAVVGHRDVKEAYEEIRRRSSVSFSLGSTIERVARPLVRDDLIVLEEHLMTPATTPLRYVRNVDILVLIDVAVGPTEVPDIYEAYNRAAPPADLADFLAALAVSAGKGFLELPDWRPTSWSRTIAG